MPFIFEIQMPEFTTTTTNTITKVKFFPLQESKIASNGIQTSLQLSSSLFL
jgi:hypothetical protein